MKANLTAVVVALLCTVLFNTADAAEPTARAVEVESRVIYEPKENPAAHISRSGYLPERKSTAAR